MLFISSPNRFFSFRFPFDGIFTGIFAFSLTSRMLEEKSKEKRRKSEIEIETDAKSYIRFSNDNIRCCRRIESCHDLDVGRRNKEEFSRFFSALLRRIFTYPANHHSKSNQRFLSCHGGAFFTCC